MEFFAIGSPSLLTASPQDISGKAFEDAQKAADITRHTQAARDVAVGECIAEHQENQPPVDTPPTLSALVAGLAGFASTRAYYIAAEAAAPNSGQ